jgi:hypothetical protein
MKVLIFLLIAGIAGFGYMEHNALQSASDRADKAEADAANSSQALGDAQRQVDSLKAQLSSSQQQIAALTGAVRAASARPMGGGQPALAAQQAAPTQSSAPLQSVVSTPAPVPAQPQTTVSNSWMWSNNSPLDEPAQAVTGGVQEHKKKKK